MKKEMLLISIFIFMIINLANAQDEFGFDSEKLPRINPAISITPTTTFFVISNVTDTNASTVCSGNEVLLGNGSCKDSTGFGGATGDNESWNQSFADSLFILKSEEGNLNTNSSTWWAKLTGWVEGWFINVENELSFNETKLDDRIKNLTSSITYNASLITTDEGTLDAGDINSIQTAKDGDTYNVSEDAGVQPNMIITVNFTGVEMFNTIILREHYQGGSGHEIEVCLYKIGEYECEYLTITDMESFAFANVPVLDPSNHIIGVEVSLQFNHVSTGNANHNFFLDYVVLIDGFTSTTTIEHDALSGRDAIGNHPWAMATSDIRIATNISSLNWDNVTISESQVTNLDKYTKLEVDNNLSNYWKAEDSLESRNFTGGNLSVDELLLRVGSNVDYKFLKGTIHPSELVLQNQLNDNVGRFALMTKKNDGGDTNLFRIYGSGTESLFSGYLSSGSYKISSGSKALTIAGTPITIDGIGGVSITGGNLDVEGDIVLSGDSGSIDFDGGNANFVGADSNGYIFTANVTATGFEESSIVLDKQGKSALSYFTTTSKERTKLDGSYNHKNKDDIDLLYSAKNIITCEKERVVNDTLYDGDEIIHQTYTYNDINCVSNLLETKSVSLLIELQRDAIFELKKLVIDLEARVKYLENNCILK